MLKLLKRKTSLHMRLKKSRCRLNLAQQYLHRVKYKHERLIQEYQRTDESLAMVDGRFNKIEPLTSGKKSTTAKIVKNLTQDQIDKIAELLGISLGKD